MIETGRLLSVSSTGAPDDQPKTESRMFKVLIQGWIFQPKKKSIIFIINLISLLPMQFGELQVEVTPDKANIGALISLVFG